MNPPLSRTDILASQSYHELTVAIQHLQQVQHALGVRGSWEQQPPRDAQHALAHMEEAGLRADAASKLIAQLAELESGR